MELFTLKKVDERLWPYIRGSGAIFNAFSGEEWGCNVLETAFYPGHLVMMLKWQKPSWTLMFLDTAPSPLQLTEKELRDLKSYIVKNYSHFYSVY